MWYVCKMEPGCELVDVKLTEAEAHEAADWWTRSCGFICFVAYYPA